MKRPDDGRLVVISVPFYRIARVSLSPVVLDALRERGDVVIVAPFASEPGFRADFGAPGTVFEQWQLNPLGRGERLLLAASEVLRRNGYWRRFRREGLAYYLKNQFKVFDSSGQDPRLRPAVRLAYWLLSWLGRRPGAWKVADRLLGDRWCRFPGLVDLAARYRRVTLVQSANWGLQDRALATLSRRHGWRRVLLPYTSDQLDTNGYLLNEFDAVCVQGPYEWDRARRIHAVPESRIERLGSVWFRHMEHIRASIGSRPAAEQGFVLYAGVSTTYFRRESEVAAVDAIADYLARSAPHLRLHYRPVEPDEGGRVVLAERYRSSPFVRLQWPSGSHLGLERYDGGDHGQSLRDYVGDLAGCRLVVMSYMTSISIDAAFLERCGVVSNMCDPDGMLRRRHTRLLNTSSTPAVRFATSTQELLEHVDALLTDRAQAARQAGELTAPWDYPGVAFRDTLVRAICGDAGEGERAS